MTEEDLTPDFGPEYFDDLATEEQKYQVERLTPFGWKVTHLWERTKGELVVWCIAHSPQTQIKTSPFRHCFIVPGGEIKRWDNGEVTRMG